MGIFRTEEEYVAQMNKGALLNPRMDSTFKALFTSPTPDSKKALISFLKAAIKENIVDVQIRQNDAPKQFDGERDVSYDILCKLDDKSYIDVEMQAFNQKYDYGKRAEYQVARLESTYLPKGASWQKAPKVYQITVLDFNYDKTDENPISRYAMRKENGRKLSGNLNIIFLELKKLKEYGKNDLKYLEPFYKWGLFLKDADNPEKIDLIESLANEEAGLMEARRTLSSISENRDLWIQQYRQEIFEIDRRSAIEAGINRGLQQGIQQGLQQGKTEIAKNLKSMGIEPAVIAKSTGLSIDEIEAL